MTLPFTRSDIIIQIHRNAREYENCLYPQALDLKTRKVVDLSPETVGCTQESCLGLGAFLVTFLLNGIPCAEFFNLLLLFTQLGSGEGKLFSE